MSSKDDMVRLARQAKLLRQIQTALCQKSLPTVLACGLTEKQLQELANEELIEVVRCKEEGETCAIHYISGITDKGNGILIRDLVLTVEDSCTLRRLVCGLLCGVFWKLLLPILAGLSVLWLALKFGLKQ